MLYGVVCDEVVIRMTGQNLVVRILSLCNSSSALCNLITQLCSNPLMSLRTLVHRVHLPSSFPAASPNRRVRKGNMIHLFYTKST